MRPPITIDDPAWATTFPHIIEPRKDEWLAGLLLRCDEINDFGSGGTLGYLLDVSLTRRLTKGFGLIQRIHLEKLARALALPLDAIIATTYQAELTRLTEATSQPWQLSSSPALFHICPLCVAEGRLLNRLHTLPGITHCPQHQVVLVRTCQCGETLRPFDRYTLPFTCICGRDWANLPKEHAGRERIETEGKRLAYYQFFLPADLPASIASVLQRIADVQGVPGRRRHSRHDSAIPSLELLVGRLLELGLSPDDFRLSVDQFPDRPSKEKGQGGLDIR